MSSASTRTALWAPIAVNGGTIRIRIPFAVVTVTPAEAFLGLGA